jgi:hypothetical protein
MQYRLAAEVHDVYQDLIVEVVIVLKSEFKPAWRRAMQLIVVVKLYDFLKSSFFKVVMVSIF